MGNQPVEEAVEFTIAILELLKTKGYNFVICTPINMEFSAKNQHDDGSLNVIFTPVKEIIDGFKLLKNLKKESFLLTLAEVEDEICLTKEPYLKFFIKLSSII